MIWNTTRKLGGCQFLPAPFLICKIHVVIGWDLGMSMSETDMNQKQADQSTPVLQIRVSELKNDFQQG